MIYHIVTGDESCNLLKRTWEEDGATEEEILTLKDYLNVGPLQAAEGYTYLSTRTEFRRTCYPGEKMSLPDSDINFAEMLARLVQIQEGHQFWLWVSPLAADVCSYFYVVNFFSKYPDRLRVININGLPFLDREKKLFFPKSFKELDAGEIRKARKLARSLTATEIEADCEDWNRIVAEDALMRTLEGGKKIVSRPDNYYDPVLLGLCTTQFVKVGRILTQALPQVQVSEHYLLWRIKVLLEGGKLTGLGEMSNRPRNMEIRLHEGEQQLTLNI